MFCVFNKNYLRSNGNVLFFYGLLIEHEHKEQVDSVGSIFHFCPNSICKEEIVQNELKAQQFSFLLLCNPQLL